MRLNDSACFSMLAYVHVAGWLSLLIAAFSAGRPKASQPMGCSTSKPAMLAWRAMTSPMV